MTVIGNLARMKSPKPTVLPQGTGQQTAAHQTMIQNAVRGAGGAKKKRAPKTSHYIKAHKTKRGVQVRGHRAKQRVVKSTGKLAAHFKKGSLAAKRHMSALRKLKAAKKSGG
jgi:hypothetical protein